MNYQKLTYLGAEGADSLLDDIFSISKKQKYLPYS
jgi:hypothetical protein